MITKPLIKFAFLIIPMISNAQKNTQYFRDYFASNYDNLMEIEGIYRVSFEVSNPVMYCKNCDYPKFKIDNYEDIVIYFENNEGIIYSITRGMNIGKVELKSLSIFNEYERALSNAIGESDPVVNYEYRFHYDVKGFITSDHYSTAWSLGHSSDVDGNKVFQLFDYPTAKKMIVNCNSNHNFSFVCQNLNVTFNYLKLFPTEDFDPPAKASSGTGFFISDNYILTNYHVIQNHGHAVPHGSKKKIIGKDKPADKITISLGITSNPTYLVSVKNYRADVDLALLEVDLSENDRLLINPLKISQRNVQIGQSVSALGYPFGSITGTSVKYTKGYVSSESGYLDRDDLCTIDLGINPGNSGGPLLDENNFVVGVVVARLNDNITGSKVENLAYAIKASIIKDFLTEENIKLGQPNQERAELSDIKSGIVHISATSY